MAAPRFVPPSRPQLTAPSARAIVALAGPRLVERVVVVGLRGYYLDTMGRPGTNDRGLYDDALVIVGPGVFVAFNANCDPSLGRPGIAVLTPGVWAYRVGTHGLSKPPAQRYTALVQAGPVTVARDPVLAGAPPRLETGWFGINIHRGGYTTTSSLGCQTIYPDQWPEFIGTVVRETRTRGQAEIPYVLTDKRVS